MASDIGLYIFKLSFVVVVIAVICCLTRKQLTMSRNFHQNGDIDKLYLPKGQGGHGIKMIARMFEGRIISIAQYVKMNKSENNILDFVYQQGQQKIIRLSQQLLQLFVKADLLAQKERYTSKVMRSYYERKIMDDPRIDKQLRNAWRKDRYLTSEEENYMSVIQDQELSANFFQNKRDRDSGENPNCNYKCRLCINNTVGISHIIAGCSQMSARCYLPLRHDEVAFLVNSL